MKITILTIVFSSVMVLIANSIFAATLDTCVQPTSIKFSNTSPTEGDQISISVNVKNIGTEDILEDIEVRFTEGDPDMGGLQIGKDVLISGGLTARNSALVTTKWIAGAGNTDIYIIVDPNNKLSESNKDNNRAFKTIQTYPWQGMSVTPTRITGAISKGLRWLREQQKDGTWNSDNGPLPTAYAILAFLCLNPDESNAVVKAGMNYLFNNTQQPFKESNPYDLSMKILSLTSTGNKSKYYNEVVDATRKLLEFNWNDTTYFNSSNIQHAILALYSAELWNVEVEKAQWRRIEDWLIDIQRNDGGWSDIETSSSSGTMTATAILGLKLAGVSPENQHIQSGIKWLDRHFSVVRNPGNNAWLFHYLLALQRAMTIPTEQKMLGNRDWYEQGVMCLITKQLPDGKWHIDPPTNSAKDMANEYCDVMTTSLALMFLIKYNPSSPLPDLSGPTLQPIVFFKTDPQLGDRLEVKATIENISKVDSESAEAIFFDGDPQAGGIQIGTAQAISPLTAGEQVLISTVWTVRSIGIHRIFVVIDTSNSIKESDETNNRLYSDIQVTGDAKADKQEIPSAVKVADRVYKIGNIIVDLNKFEITIQGKVNMQKGLIEYLACAPGGKLHESTLVLDVDPIHLHVALILLGLEPRGDFKFQGDPGSPKGDPVEIWVQWQESESIKQVRAEQLICKTQKEEPMEFTYWIFTGSAIYNNIYLASIDKSLIATYHDPAAIINNPLPEGADDTVYYVNPRIIPNVGTPITMIIKKLE